MIALQESSNSEIVYDTEGSPTCVLTTVHDDATGADVCVGWDICGGCHRFISRCRCGSGLVLPKYIKEWNGVQPSYVTTSPKPVEPKGVRDVFPEGYVKPERDPATGRKVRKDKGVKRGPVPATLAPKTKSH